MGILNSFKKLFSGDSQAGKRHDTTQPQPPPQGAEGKPSGQAESPPSRDTVNPAGETEEEFVDLFEEDPQEQSFVDLYDDTQH